MECFYGNPALFRYSSSVDLNSQSMKLLNEDLYAVCSAV